MMAACSCIAPHCSEEEEEARTLGEQSSPYQGANVTVTLGCKTQMLCTKEFNGQLLLGVIHGGQDRWFFVLENWMLGF